MKQSENDSQDKVFRVETISQLHEIAGFEKPKHPLVTIIDYSKVKVVESPAKASFVCSFYSVNFKKHCQFMYGRQLFDHQEGTLHCIAPEQIITVDRQTEGESSEGWGLYFHPELIRNTALGEQIQEFSFFLYGANEALHLSDQEKQTLVSILKLMETEYNTNIDHYSQGLIISNIELLLQYCKRYYGRQFITRTNQNKDVIVRFEAFIRDYINSAALKETGLPTVKFCAEKMNLSTNYFSDLLKSETGKNAQEHIHYYVLEKAKTMLRTKNASVAEIASELGFEYPQYFSTLFRKKIGVSPSVYRAG